MKQEIEDSFSVNFDTGTDNTVQQLISHINTIPSTTSLQTKPAQMKIETTLAELKYSEDSSSNMLESSPSDTLSDLVAGYDAAANEYIVAGNWSDVAPPQ